MSIEALVYGRLTTYSGITAIASTRTYPMRLPQNPTLPAISYQKISNTEQKGSSNLKDSRYQLNCWATTYAEAHSLAAQVKAAFEEWHDANQTPGVLMARMVGETDTEDDDTKTYRVILDVFLTTTGD
jgi:hypothetical protein